MPNTNTLTSLIPDAYRALDVVSRELVGFIAAVQMDPTQDTIAINQSIRIPAAPVNTDGKDITPAMAFPLATYQTITNTSHTLSKQRAYPFSWQQEEVKSVDVGPGFLTIQQGQIAQALRGLVNEIETDIAVAAYKGASRAFGTTAGTAPILSDYANIKKVLDDNGAPPTDRHVVFDTTAGVALRNTSNLFKVNEAGDSALLRQGALGNLYGFDLRESAQIQTITAGTMANATSTSAAFTVGQTAIPLATAGTGLVARGDIITFANDTNKYVVSSVVFAGANPASGDTITLAAPGLRKAQGVATRAITVFATSARNAAFSRNAILLSTRLPATVPNDIAIDRQVITDPKSNISFEFALYPGYRMSHIEISAVWGVTVIKPEHLAIIIG